MTDRKVVPITGKHTSTTAVYFVEEFEFTTFGGFSAPGHQATGTAVLMRLDPLDGPISHNMPKRVEIKGTLMDGFPMCGDQFQLSMKRVKKAKRIMGRV